MKQRPDHTEVRRIERKETITMLSLIQASDIVDAALKKARELELRPLSITVLDPGGHPVVVKREDAAGTLPQFTRRQIVSGLDEIRSNFTADPTHAEAAA